MTKLRRCSLTLILVLILGGGLTLAQSPERVKGSHRYMRTTRVRAIRSAIAPPCAPDNSYCEDNDTPGTAYGPLDLWAPYRAFPDDQEDWYYFELATDTGIAVKVTDFTGGDGRLMVYHESDTTNPVPGGYWNAGGPTMTVNLDNLSPGLYYVRVFTGMATNSTTLYTLVVRENAIFLPLILRIPYTCPTTSANLYAQGTAYQYDTDNPVRPAYNHADKNIVLRSYTPNTDPDLQRELVDYGIVEPTQPPQIATLFNPHRVPNPRGFYQVHNWNWAPSPNPGTRGDPITSPPVTALGLATTPGEDLHVPTSGFDIGVGMEVIVIYADEDTVTLKYTREDSAATGYTLHIDNICTDPNLLALYNSLDDPTGPRYEFPRHSYDLPNLPSGKPIGTARDTQIVVVIADSGTFQDTRSCSDWWIIRPGYTGTCPPAR